MITPNQWPTFDHVANIHYHIIRAAGQYHKSVDMFCSHFQLHKTSSCTYCSQHDSEDEPPITPDGDQWGWSAARNRHRIPHRAEEDGKESTFQQLWLPPCSKQWEVVQYVIWQMFYHNNILIIFQKFYHNKFHFPNVLPKQYFENVSKKYSKKLTMYIH